MFIVSGNCRNQIQKEVILILKTCSIYGQMKINKEQLELVEIVLSETIANAVRRGYNHFITSMSGDINMVVSDIIGTIKAKHHEIILEGVMTETIKKQKILKHLNGIKFINKNEYPDQIYEMQKYMARSSELLIVVWDGDELNDAHDAIQIASDYGIETEIIPIER